jgi:hypothetical protein
MINKSAADKPRFCLGIGEVGNFALHPITLAVALHGVNRVVVGRLRLKAIPRRRMVTIARVSWANHQFSISAVVVQVKRCLGPTTRTRADEFAKHRRKGKNQRAPQLLSVRTRRGFVKGSISVVPEGSKAHLKSQPSSFVSISYRRRRRPRDGSMQSTHDEMRRIFDTEGDLGRLLGAFARTAAA